MSIPDAAKIARYDDLANLVDELHNSNIELRSVLRDLIATIDLHTDCMSNQIDREPLDDYIERAEKLLEKFGAGETAVTQPDHYEIPAFLRKGRD